MAESGASLTDAALGLLALDRGLQPHLLDVERLGGRKVQPGLRPGVLQFLLFAALLVSDARGGAHVLAGLAPPAWPTAHGGRGVALGRVEIAIKMIALKT